MIGQATENIVALLYGIWFQTNKYGFKCRLESFKKLSKNRKFPLSQLPPTSYAAKQHGYYMYLQMHYCKETLI